MPRPLNAYLLAAISTFALSAFLAAPHAVAQSAPPVEPAEAPPPPPDTGTAVKTLTVNANKEKSSFAVEQEIQHIPQPVSNFSADRLAQEAVTNVRELMRQVPGLAGVPANNFSDQAFFLRGIGEPDVQGEPSIAEYVDGVFLPKALGTNQELLDIDHITVERGPASFDGGHTAEAGAVHIFTTVPDNTIKANALVGYGSYNEWKIGAAVSGPIVADKFFVSAAVSHHERDGTNISLPNNAAATDIDYTQGRLKLRFTPSDDLELISSFDGTKDSGTNYADANLVASDGNHYDGHNLAYPKNEYDELGWTGTVNYKISDQWQLSSLTSVRGFNNYSNYDNSGDAFARTTQFLIYQDRAYSQEIKLTGDLGPVNVTGGLYAFHEKWNTDRRANNAASTDASSPLFAVLSPVDALIQQDTTSYSAYLQAKYQVTDEFNVLLGGRVNHEIHWNHEDLNCLLPGVITAFGTTGAACPNAGKETTAGQVANELIALAANSPQAPAWDANGKASYNTFEPKIALTYQCTPEILQYVSFSQGTKDGGFDYRGQTVGNPFQERLPYSPEVLTTYETGFKTSLFQNRALINLSGFFNQFDNIQLTTTDPSVTPAVSHRFNDGSAHSDGAELETTFYPTDGLELHAFGDYVFSRLDHIKSPTSIKYYGTIPFHTAPYVGAKLPEAPRWQTSFSFNYKLPLSIPGAVTIGSTLTFQSAYYADTTNNPENEIPRQTLLTALTSYTSEDGHWTAQITGKNLLNKRYPQGLTYTSTSSAAAAAVTPIPAYYTVYYNDPRSIFFSLAYKL